MRLLVLAACLLLPLVDLAWNLTHLSVGLVDFYGLAASARGLVYDGAWPATPYFPAGYPLLLVPFGLAGSVLIGGYVLSALGLMLGLRSVAGLSLELRLPRWTALPVILLAWLSPSYRIVAASPSVDALYTGLGLAFLWAAVAIWQRRAPQTRVLEDVRARRAVESTGALWERLLPYGASLGLILPAILLPLLRYHALLLVVPVLLVLWQLRPAARYAINSAAFGLALAVTLNLLLWAADYGGMLPSATQAQVRVGLEIDRPTQYPSIFHLWADYPDFARHARSGSIIADYGAGALITHTLSSWLMYLRRPAVALTLLLALALLVLRRRLPEGVPIMALWALGYTLALSPAYYTPRASLLPELALIPALLALAAAVTPQQSGSRAAWAMGAMALFLLLAYLPAGRFARFIHYQERDYAQVSRQFAAYLRQHEIAPERVLVADIGVVWLPNDPAPNPWSRPYRMLRHTWMSDPAIDLQQKRGIRVLELDDLLAGQGGVQLVLVNTWDWSNLELETLRASPAWDEVAGFGDQVVFRPAGVVPQQY